MIRKFFNRILGLVYLYFGLMFFLAPIVQLFGEEKIFTKSIFPILFGIGLIYIGLYRIIKGKHPYPSKETGDGLKYDRLFKKKNKKEKLPLKSKDFVERLNNAEKIINNYGTSIVENKGRYLFKESTLRNSKKDIVTAYKVYVEELIKNNLYNEDNESALIDTFGSLEFFVDDSLAESINLEYLRDSSLENGDSEYFSETMKVILKYNGRKLNRMEYFTEYINNLKGDL